MAPSGKRALVTGTGGLGLEIARGLAAKGWQVVVAGRSETAGQTAISSIRQSRPSADIRFEPLDLAKPDSISACAERLVVDGRPLDALVNSAGLIAMSRQETASGAEMMFGVNYLGHFALTGRLLPLLRASASPRVVTIVGAAYRNASIAFDDPNSTQSFKAMQAGGQSMLAKALFARELQRRSDAYGWGLTSLAADPGLARTDLLNRPGVPGVFKVMANIMGSLLGHSAADGAAIAVHAATAADIVPGGLYAPASRSGLKGPPGLTEMAPSGQNAEDARRLWDMSQEMTGHPFPG